MKLRYDGKEWLPTQIDYEQLPKEASSMSDPLVSVVIPTRNSATTFESCLLSIRRQTHRNVEIVVVDGGSSDSTVSIAERYSDIVKIVDTRTITEGHFTATYQRNLGAEISGGEIIYYVDADMILTPTVISDSLAKIQKGFDAVIVPEDSYGKGFWADCKKLERRCYWNDDTVEAPRFIRKTAWVAVGGLDERVAGGGDDWDLYQKLLERGYKVGRVKSLVMHNEGMLTISKLARKRIMYGRDVLKYLRKRKRGALVSFSPFRFAFIRNRGLFVSDPLHAAGVAYMRTIEYASGLIGLLVGLFEA